MQPRSSPAPRDVDVEVDLQIVASLDTFSRSSTELVERGLIGCGGGFRAEYFR